MARPLTTGKALKRIWRIGWIPLPINTCMAPRGSSRGHIMTMKIEQNKRRAGFPMQKNLDDFDDDFHTTISKREVNSLLDFGFIDNRENVVFIGSPGVGKTHLAIGLGLKAIEAGYKVCFSMALTLIEALEQAELKGELKRNSPTGESSFLTVMSPYLSLTELSIIHTFLCWEGGSYRLKSKLNK